MAVSRLMQMGRPIISRGKERVDVFGSMVMFHSGPGVSVVGFWL
jgi:hypothetical protein